MSSAFRTCAMPCQRYITDDSHDLYVICLGAEHTQSALKGAGCTHCDHFTVKNLHSHLVLFKGDGSQEFAPCGLCPATALIMGVTG